MKKEKTILFSGPVESASRELQDLLIQEGFKAIEVKTLKETLLTLQDRRVDVLVLDSSLLEEDYEFLSVIRGIDKDLPIIICAGTNSPEFESNIRQQRIFYYHIKSFGIEDLKMAISNAANYFPHHAGGASHAVKGKD